MKKTGLGIAIAWAGLAWSAGAAGQATQAIPDPTRPPMVPRAAADSAASVPAGPPPVLQSVLIGRERSMAIISGQRFDVGDRVGEARIVRITETEVVLRSGESMTTLKLFPQIEKRMKLHPAKPGAASPPQHPQNNKSAMTTREKEA